ncbi:MAG: shikimate kinase [Verrucomicrobia bacterium]|nr:shikimate kinase [Verrucomicrobiota bacterium]
MAEPRTIRNLALAGFMGTGKSSVGQLVAQELGFEFVDTDAMIEARTGRNIGDIFTEAGEALFRRLETEVLDGLAARADMVISTGGGLIVNPANLASLKSHALVACLWATPATILERTRGHTHRPLLQDPDPLSKIRELLAQREKAYKQADLLINTESRSIREVAQHVLLQFRQAREKSG